MSTKDTGGQAFPIKVASEPKTAPNGLMYRDEVAHPGMTLRDYFAAKALESGLASNWRDNDFKPRNGFSIIQNTAFAAYEFADAMLKARTE